eukprot:COSAG01_NODE_7252_length_3281_cov_239.018542_6_plen_154_part_00
MAAPVTVFARQCLRTKHFAEIQPRLLNLELRGGQLLSGPSYSVTLRGDYTLSSRQLLRLREAVNCQPACSVLCRQTITASDSCAHLLQQGSGPRRRRRFLRLQRLKPFLQLGTLSCQRRCFILLQDMTATTATQNSHSEMTLNTSVGPGGHNV